MSTHRIALVSIAMLASAPALAGGTVPDVLFLPTSARALDVSADGSLVVGVQGSGAFQWTQANGIVPFTGASFSSGTNVRVAGDGSAFGLDVNDADQKMHAARSTDGTSWDELPVIGPSCDAFLLNFYDINADGSVIVGLGWVEACRAHAFRWDPVNGTVDLGSTVPGRSSRANGVNGAGDVVVGWQDLANGTRQGARWNDGVQSLFTYMAPGGQTYLCGEAQCANTAGSVVAGITLFGLSGGDAWRWDEATDATTLLPQLPGFTGNNAIPLGMTPDGSTIVGTTGGFFIGRSAIIWIDGVAQDLKTYIESLGGSIAPYSTLGTAMAISDDGRTIVGWGAGGFGEPGGWIMTLPAATCAADLNGDGIVNGADLGDLLAQWGNRGGAADLNGDGIVDGADLGLLHAAWGPC